MNSKELSFYTMCLDQTDLRMISNKVNTKGHDSYIEECIKEMNVVNNQYLQTIDYRYKYLISVLIKLEADIDIISKIHKANIEYEKVNPPIIYTKKKSAKIAKTKTSIKKTAKSSASAPPVEESRSDMVTIINITTNKSLKVSRETANALMYQFVGKYKIE